MTDSEYMILSCPNGHEIQAAKSDFNKKLACPVCSVHFVPAQQTGGSYAPPTDSALDYGASGGLINAEYPGITPALRYLWLSIGVLQTGSTIYNLVAKTPKQAATPTPGLMVFGCIVMIAILVACVLQLMWIHRIHRDAQEKLGYDRVSPGMAIFISFIPVLNTIWTGLAMLWLSTFADQKAHSGSSPDQSSSTRKSSTSISRLCLIISVVTVLVGCGTYGVLFSNAYRIQNEILASGVSRPTPEFQEQFQDRVIEETPKWAIPATAPIPLLMTAVYFVAVRRLEDSLYPLMGAPPR